MLLNNSYGYAQKKESLYFGRKKTRIVNEHIYMRDKGLLTEEELQEELEKLEQEYNQIIKRIMNT